MTKRFFCFIHKSLESLDSRHAISTIPAFGDAKVICNIIYAQHYNLHLKIARKATLKVMPLLTMQRYLFLSYGFLPCFHLSYPWILVELRFEVRLLQRNTLPYPKVTLVTLVGNIG